MRLLVLAAEAVDAAAVRSALPDQDLEGAEVLVVSPALNQSKLAFWVSDSDEAIAEAKEAEEQTVASLRGEGARATGTTGESEPLLALQDALATFEADRILIFGDHGDVANQARERFGVPVDVASR
jgi:hypothetical protein